MKIRTLQALTVTTLLIAQISSGQITQLEQKETLSFLRTQYARDYYKFSPVTNTITLPEGRKFDIIDFYYRTGHYCYINIDTKYDTSSGVFRIFSAYLQPGPVTPSPSPTGRSIIGPATIYLIMSPGQDEYYTNEGADISDNSYFSGANALWRYEISNYNTLSQSTTTPTVSSASVVVPSNAVGDVDVLLEQSTDMITWTQCLPGTYNASTQKRFFRVRAVEK